MINSLEQDSRPNFSKPGKEPTTPEFETQATQRSRSGVLTPDATPGPQRITSPGHKQAFVHLGSQRDPDLTTPSISSKPPSVEETENNRDNLQHYTHSEISDQASERPSPPLTPGPYLDQEINYSVSVFKSIYTSVIRLLNLAKQRKSRADDARVQSTIDLIKSLPTIRRTRVGNLTRTLTAKQYGELLKAIKESEDDEFRSYFKDQLRISNAAKTVKPSGSADVRFPFARGEGDSKSPDRSFRHKQCECTPLCVYPTWLIEIGWSQEMKKLQDKAEAYICRSNGQIRTVVAIYMRKMYLAEVKNEKRLYEGYLTGEVDENGFYATDEKNETGEASILVWRAVVRRNGTVDAVRVQDEEFRDKNGRAIESVSLRLPLQDFICKRIADSPEGKFKESLDISSEALCESIDDTLKYYRQERGEIKKEEAEEEKKKRLQEAT
ncbi:hypothetical protein E0Z10_g29 [Xylaria hypoxylon]|uniref:Uncharacterized protein n=1 Tax=Xylaria hypoxylon TaxID=37992 RepID=A0A4Z0YXH6_9PEZI|nr:hypothetical protein E0Z10_g29 [Xylaria hypoxylon]